MKKLLIVLVLMLISLSIVSAEIYPAGTPIQIFDEPNCDGNTEVIVKAYPNDVSEEPLEGEYELLQCTLLFTDHWRCGCEADFFADDLVERRFDLDIIYSLISATDTSKSRRKVNIEIVQENEDAELAQYEYPIPTPVPVLFDLEEEDPNRLDKFEKTSVVVEVVKEENITPPVPELIITPVVVEEVVPEPEPVKEPIVDELPEFDVFIESEEFKQLQEQPTITSEYVDLRVEEAERIKKIFWNFMGFMALIGFAAHVMYKKDKEKKYLERQQQFVEQELEGGGQN